MAFGDYSLGARLLGWFGPHSFLGSSVGYWFRLFQWTEPQMHIKKKKCKFIQILPIQIQIYPIDFMSIPHFNYTTTPGFQQDHHNLSFYLSHSTREVVSE